MSDAQLFALGSICVNVVSSYIILDRVQCKIRGYTYLLMLVANAIILGWLGMYYYPLSKIAILIVDVTVVGFCFAHHRRQELLEDVYFALLIGSCEVISQPVYEFIVLAINHSVTINIQTYVVILGITQLAMLYIYRFYKRITKDRKEKQPVYVRVFQIIILPAFTFINISVMTMMSAYYMLPTMLLFILLDLLFVVFLNVYIFYLMEKMAENNRLTQEKIRLEEVSAMQYSYYQKLEKKYENSRKVIHDVKRHIQVLEHQALAQEHVTPYSKDMKQLLEAYTQPVYCSHSIINIILTEKIEEAKHEDIEVTCKIAPVNFVFLREIDITTIFANLLDNAIDACKMVNDHRYIELQIDQRHEFLVFIIKNSAIAITAWDSSSKKDHDGLGLVNVKQVVESYGGNMQIESNSDSFLVQLFIPMS